MIGNLTVNCESVNNIEARTDGDRNLVSINMIDVDDFHLLSQIIKLKGKHAVLDFFSDDELKKYLEGK